MRPLKNYYLVDLSALEKLNGNVEYEVIESFSQFGFALVRSNDEKFIYSLSYSSGYEYWIDLTSFYEAVLGMPRKVIFDLIDRNVTSSKVRRLVADELSESCYITRKFAEKLVNYLIS